MQLQLQLCFRFRWLKSGLSCNNNPYLFTSSWNLCENSAREIHEFLAWVTHTWIFFSESWSIYFSWNLKKHRKSVPIFIATILIFCLFVTVQINNNFNIEKQKSVFPRQVDLKQTWWNKMLFYICRSILIFEQRIHFSRVKAATSGPSKEIQCS
jgi:hypothetical protein